MTNYFCNCCQYRATKKSNYERHLLSEKHLKKSQVEDATEEKEIHFPRKPKIVKVDEVKESISRCEISTQTDFEIETDDSEAIIELENKNISLEDEVYELKYQLKEKNEEIKQLIINQQKYIEKLEEDKVRQIEQVNEEKYSLCDRIQELEEESELKDKKIKELNELTQTKQKCNIEMTIEPEPEREPELKPESKPIVECKPSKKKISISKVEIVQPTENELKLMRELDELRNQVVKSHSETSQPKQMNKSINKKKSPKNYDSENEGIKADRPERPDRDINNYRDTDNLMNIFKFKKLCRNSDYNRFIRYYTYINENDVETSILLPNDMALLEKGSESEKFTERGYQNEIYMIMINELLSHVNYRHIPIICINKKNRKFKVFDFELKEWIDVYNERQLIDYLEDYINILSSTLSEAVTNLRMNDDVNDEIIRRMFDSHSKKEYLISYRAQDLLKNTINPLSDTSIHENNSSRECDLFKTKLINHLIENFSMSKEHYVSLEKYTEKIDWELDYSLNFDKFEYVPYHGKPYVKPMIKCNDITFWEDD